MLRYIETNYALLIIAAAVLLFPAVLNQTRRQRGLLKCATIMMVVLSISETVERSLGMLPQLTYWRVVLSVINYILRPIVLFKFIAYRDEKAERKWYLIAPLILNTLIMSSALYCDVAFSYTEANGFCRGPLGYTQHVVSTYYGAYIFWDILRIKDDSFRERLPLLVSILSIFGAMLIETTGTRVLLTDLTTLLFCLLFEFYHCRYYARRDILTGLYNRVVYTSDLKKYYSRMTGMALIDMNDLKFINDTQGHQAGDEAIRAAANCVTEALAGAGRVYRIGGDEFAVLLTGTGCESFRDALKQKSAAAGCNFSTGMAAVCPGETSKELVKRADEDMYRNKRKYYEDNHIDRRKRRQE